MLTAVVARPPVVGGKVKSADTAAALAVPGVVKVVEIPGSGLGSKFKPLGGIAVVARNTWSAMKGRDALVIEWDAGPQGSANTADQETELRASASATGPPGRKSGGWGKSVSLRVDTGGCHTIKKNQNKKIE